MTIKNIVESIAGSTAEALFYVALVALYALPVMWFWNDALPSAVNGINPITYWQAICITLLCDILFMTKKNIG